jgi:hypothetical protein
MLFPCSFLHSLLLLSFSSVNILKNFIYECFQNSKDPIIAKLYHKFIEPERRHLQRSIMAGLSRLCTETKYSFFCGKLFAIPSLKFVPCKVIEIPGMSYTITASMIISKRSPYKKFLNYLWVHLSVFIVTLSYEYYYTYYTYKDIWLIVLTDLCQSQILS